MSDNGVTSPKKKLRKQLKAKRDELSETEYQKKSDLIVKRVLNSKYYQNSSTIHSFVPIIERKEVNVEPLLAQAIESGRRVVCPKMEFENNVMHHYEIGSLEELIANEWGIREPKTDIPVSSESINMVLVPMLGGDESLRRLGYGKGYYDRFLSEVNAYKIGLLFYEALLPVNSIPVEAHDVTLDAIVTDKEIIS